MNEIDKDGNDEINFDEFIQAMEKVIHPEVTPVSKKSKEKINSEEEKEEEPLGKQRDTANTEKLPSGSSKKLPPIGEKVDLK